MFSTIGWVADDPAWPSVERSKVSGEARKVILTDTELQRLIEACGPGLRDLVMVGAYTGCRLGELMSARTRDLDGHVLHVQGKTGRRVVHLPADAAVLLRTLAQGKSADAYLLTTGSGKPWTAAQHQHQKKFAKAVACAGLDPATTYYSLRHSFISRALAAGVPIRAVAEHCGTGWS